MDKKQARVDLGASVIAQNQNLLHETEVFICKFLGVSSSGMTRDSMNLVKGECAHKVWDTIRSSLFYAIYDCIEERFKKLCL